jgi:hypothetical protein
LEKSFLILLDFENLNLKTTIKNYNIILFGDKFTILNNVPSLAFDEFFGIIFTKIEIKKHNNLIIIYRGNYEKEEVIKSYFQNNLEKLNKTYFGVILDITERKLIIFGNFYFFKEKYRERYFIWTDFDLFYKLSEWTINEKSAIDFIREYKSNIIEMENRLLIFDLKERNLEFSFLDRLSRKKIFKKFKKVPKIEKFYYYFPIEDLIVFENLKSLEKLPIGIFSLYQIENIYKKSFNLDFENRIITSSQIRTIINQNFENFYNAYKFFNLSNWLIDFIFNPIIIYRAFILRNILSNFRL